MTDRHHFFHTAAIESLEPRRLLATAVQAFINDEGRLMVLGSEAPEAIQMGRSPDDQLEVTVWTTSSTPDQAWLFNDDEFTTVLVDGGGGDDSLWINHVLHYARLVGGDGNDFLCGTFNGEHLDGGAGDDELYAGGGSRNTLIGGGGDDLLWSGGGNDYLRGGEGNDTLRGHVWSRFGHDDLYGGPGDDLIIGAQATDQPTTDSETLTGGPGNDTLLGRGGDDILYDADGFADTVDGGAGNDRAWRDPDLDDVSNVETVAA